MKGHEQIIQARLKGCKPSAIFINYGYGYHVDYDLRLGEFPTVSIDEGEIPDVRFTTGCKVHFNAKKSTESALKTIEKIIDANPEMLIWMDMEKDILCRYINGDWDDA